MRRFRKLVPLLAIMLLIAGACSNDDDGGGDGGDTGATGTTGAENTGTVNVLNAMEPAEAVAVQTAVDENIVDADYTVEIEGSADFEEQFAIRAEGGTLDIALVPQPGTVTSQAEAGHDRLARGPGARYRRAPGDVRRRTSSIARASSTASTGACRRTSTSRAWSGTRRTTSTLPATRCPPRGTS